MANWKLWPAVQFINFYLIPLNYQLLFLNVIAIGWTAFPLQRQSKAAGKNAGVQIHQGGQDDIINIDFFQIWLGNALKFPYITLFTK